MFDDGFRAEYSDHEGVAAIERSLANLQRLKVDRSDNFQLSPVSTLPGKFFNLLQYGLRRSIELGGSAVREMNDQRVISMCVLVRATLETAALLADTTYRVERDVKNENPGDLEDLNKGLTNALYGHGPKAKDPWMLLEHCVSTNILTVIQRVTKKMNIPAEEFFDALCEHAHPNYHGMMAVYCDRDVLGVATFTDCNVLRARAATILSIGALAMSLEMVEGCLRAHSRLSSELATMSEKVIYERGTWPDGVEYPIKR